ncbi:unnamed protein product [Adineta steineri]|uniref:Uncharacterized protein n=2 Tax=Adineta steineri TaxID=433720 RepID=A0A814UCP9_9BILA|nr:unnamed protein product [Adineta steineri]
MPNQSKAAEGFFDRSNKDSSPFPRLVFTILRAIDPYLQSILIFNGFGHQILSKAGITTVPAGPKGAVLVAMAAGCAVKQIINMTYILETRMINSAVIGICLYNTISNSFASLSSIIYGPSNELGSLQYIGISLFTVAELYQISASFIIQSITTNVHLSLSILIRDANLFRSLALNNATALQILMHYHGCILSNNEVVF